jgi:DNA polymerase-1
MLGQDNPHSEWIEGLLAWRKVDKALEFANKYQDYATDTIHAEIHPWFPVTGRWSYAKPNMQQVPPELRPAFIPREGHSFIEVDLKTVEFYLLGLLSGETKITQPYEEGHDVHQETANLAGIDRQQAKTTNFALAYGVTDYTLARRLRTSEGRAGEIRQAVLGSFPRLSAYFGEVLDFTRKNGYTMGIGARKRRLHNIQHKDAWVRARAERQAINFTAQGSAALVTKRSMLRTRCRVAEALPLLQVHDSTLYEVPTAQAEDIAEAIKEQWEKDETGVKVDVAIRDRWIKE